MGFTRTWKELVGTRIVLGLLESGYFPGSIYLLSCWYVRCEYSDPLFPHATLTPLDDVQKRFSVFYLIGCVASAASGILAFGLMQLAGVQGLGGWRWIFILEGVVCHRHV